ncbi:pantoate--beta-alanine ligase [Sphingomonas astaxanthinifaciens]|uniref:Pantothenate synthetase n=1 Tax=Sphingomonas astaxanthinifaciens DSM 22298 TaxID=1123267 RepID=A0ABQ5Z8K3_9SPHN|nr:pantoate--beta-alanine ligase [Sphingomonas astaxanthinifaciens]GLR47109.1 pantothenate synthetase [Sphingomonas astaxanthinifaciens DSM 22298]
MQIIRALDGLELGVAMVRQHGNTLALVPTMGALHDGHLALIAEARRVADRVAATIFVNPLQFNDPKDLEKYPRTEEADLAKLEAAGCDLVWLPTPDQLYPAGFATSISVRGVSERWEGEHRPGHFDGVATVVAKLLLAVRPDIAIFGEKDWQQLAVIRRMATDLGLGIGILGHPTVREADGLAMSSRNALLGTDERAQAVAIPQVLGEIARQILAGESVAASLANGKARLLAAGFSGVDYLALVDGASLEPLETVGENMRLLVAAKLGTVRLIDNIPVTSEQQVSW